MAPTKKPDHRNNPRNPAAPLFKRLTRIFSGPLINYRAQFTREERRSALDKYQTRFNSMSGHQFKRSADNLSRNYNMLTSAAMRNQNRNERYIDFDQMEYMPEIASALDIYADEMSTSNEFNKIIKVECRNEEIKNILNALFYDVLNIEFNAFGWARTMCKYGDFFLYLDVDEVLGVKSVIGLPSGEVERLEGQDPTNPNYVQYQWNSANMTFENWQLAHFRILGNDKHSPYGTSVLDPARRIWRQLVLIEDAMLAYRVVRAPERRVFKIDVGNIPPQDVEQYMEKVKTAMKRNALVDSTTGRVDLRYNPLSVEEDYFIPIRGGVGSDIVTLAGAASLNDIDDVKYIRDKLFSAIKIPHSYLSMTEGGAEDKTTLAQKDIRFARTIQRLQRALVSELEKIAVVHLFTLGFRSQDLISFKLTLNNPSRLAELQEIEHMRTKFDLANNVVEGMFSKHWIAQNILNMTDEEFLRNQREAYYDRKYQAALDAVTEAAAQEAAGGGMGLPPADEMTPEELVAAPPAEEGALPGSPAAPNAPGTEAPPEQAAAPETTLLAAPARREDDPTEASLMAQSKGKPYYRKKDDDRKLRRSGPTTRHLRSMSKSGGSKSHRDVFPGHQLLNTNALYEELEPTYNDEDEIRLFENMSGIKKLITQLEEKEAELETSESETQ
tara:strand:+ start:1066 stop:3072 length:2007 start_codon:yes stop_codon:yes gene_type:complete